MIPMKDNECECSEEVEEQIDFSTFSFFQTKNFVAS